MKNKEQTITTKEIPQILNAGERKLEREKIQLHIPKWIKIVLPIAALITILMWLIFYTIIHDRNISWDRDNESYPIDGITFLISGICSIICIVGSILYITRYKTKRWMWVVMSFVFLASSFAMVYSFITAIGFFLNENDPNVGKLIMYGLRYGYAWTLALIPLAVFIVTPIILAPIPKHVDGTL